MAVVLIPVSDKTHPMLRVWQKFSAACDHAVGVMTILMQAAMFVLIIAAVGARYVIKVPMPWSEELSRILMVYLGFLGASMAMRRGRHLGFQVLIERLPIKWLRPMSILVDGLIVVFLLALIRSGWDLALWVGWTQRSPYLGIPYLWIYFCIPLGGTLTLIHTIEKIMSGRGQTRVEETWSG